MIIPKLFKLFIISFTTLNIIFTQFVVVIIILLLRLRFIFSIL